MYWNAQTATAASAGAFVHCLVLHVLLSPAVLCCAVLLESPQRYVKCPMELQQLQLEIVISEDTERETQRQVLKVRPGRVGRRQQHPLQPSGSSSSSRRGPAALLLVGR
jgi:hypothetical protein